MLLTGVVGVGTWTGGSALARLRNPDNITPLRLAAERIVARVDAPFVVFGHTHEPVHELLPRAGAYVNGGTWLPAIRPGLLRAFTHVVLRRTPPARSPSSASGGRRVAPVRRRRGLADAGPGAGPAPQASPVRLAAPAPQVAAAPPARARRRPRADLAGQRAPTPAIVAA